MREPSVAAGYARGLMELAVSRGASRQILAERSGIDVADLHDQDSRIPFARYVALMRAGKELCGDPALALHFGEAFDVEELSIVGLIGRACETLADAFAQLNRYARLVAEVDLGIADRLQLERSPEGLWIVDTRLDPDAVPEITESSFARMVCMAHRLGRSELVKRVDVTHPEPPYRAEYDRIFRVPIGFSASRNAILTDEAWLTERAGSSSRYVFGILSAHADALLEALDASRSTRSRVERALLPLLHTGTASMDAVARDLGLSRQTLFRRLKTEGTTFERVLDALRHTLALHYLRGERVSVSQAAYLVGFSEPAAFSRAFKRWTGSSPRLFRLSTERPGAEWTGRSDVPSTH